MKKLSIIILICITGLIRLFAQSDARIELMESFLKANDHKIKEIQKLSDLVLQVMITHTNAETTSQVITMIDSRKKEFNEKMQIIAKVRDDSMAYIEFLLDRINEYNNDKFNYYDIHTRREHLPVLFSRIQMEVEFTEKLNIQINQYIKIEDQFEEEVEAFFVRNFKPSKISNDEDKQVETAIMERKIITPQISKKIQIDRGLSLETIHACLLMEPKDLGCNRILFDSFTGSFLESIDAHEMLNELRRQVEEIEKYFSEVTIDLEDQHNEMDATITSEYPDYSCTGGVYDDGACYEYVL